MPQPRRRPLGGALAVGVVALIAGCGATPTPSAPRSTDGGRTESATGNRGIDALTEPESADQVPAFVRAGPPIQREELEGLRALDPPEELREDHERVVSLVQATASVQDLNDRLSALETGLDAAIGALDGHTLDGPGIERRRAGLARTGPAVSDALRRFIAARVPERRRGAPAPAARGAVGDRRPPAGRPGQPVAGSAPAAPPGAAGLSRGMSRAQAAARS